MHTTYDSFTGKSVQNMKILGSQAWIWRLLYYLQAFSNSMLVHILVFTIHQVPNMAITPKTNKKT